MKQRQQDTEVANAAASVNTQEKARISKGGNDMGGGEQAENTFSAASISKYSYTNRGKQMEKQKHTEPERKFCKASNSNFQETDKNMPTSEH